MGNLPSRRPVAYFNGSFDDEQEPMLGQDRLPTVHDRIEVEDNPSQKPISLIESIRQRFTFVYIVLGLVLLIALAVLVVSIMLLCSMKKMDQRYKNMTAAGSEKFMRLYEDVSSAKGSHRNPSTLNDIVSKLPPEQLAQARAFGLLPKEQPNLGDPIKPVASRNQDKMFAASLDDLPEQITAEVSDFYTHSWHKSNSSCSIQCNKTDISVPPLLIISLDGFSRSYLDKKLVPSLETIGACGAKAEYMYPSYPSKTFPNHYTIATGLYPETHGIVDNYVYDPKVNPTMEDVRKSTKSGYFKGEPIWSSAVRQKRRMFCLMWPGCSFNITGHNPTKDIPYDKNLPYSSRVEMIVDWLKLSADQRPDLIMAYFDQPDTVGHFRQKESELDLELSYIESVLNYMFTTLHKNNLLDCINLVIVSDHGMHPINNRLYLDSLKLNATGAQIANGVISRIYLDKSKRKTESFLEDLKCRDKENFNVYDRKQVPSRYHYATERVGDVVIEGMPGTIIFENKSEDNKVLFDHGYDYIQEDMHAIFFARGPNIRPQTLVDPFQNIELFNLFTELLRIKNDAPNNGTEALLSEILFNVNLFRSTTPDISLRPIQECSPIAPLQSRHLKSCSDSKECQADVQTANTKLDGCPVHFEPSGLLYTSREDYCFINLCSILTAVDLTTSFGVPTIAFETLNQNDFTSDNSQQVCSFNDLRFEPSCDNWTATVNQKHMSDLQWTSILSNYGNELEHYNRLQFLLYNQFVNGPFAYLQNITKHYAKKYSRILVFTGAVYDFDMNGIGDDKTTFWKHISFLPKEHSNEEKVPSHIVRVIFRCSDDAWHINGVSCKRSNEMRILAFILPNVNSDLNCLAPDDYLLKNTARVRDVELLTNTQFFGERMFYPERDSIRWRLNITEELWP